MTYYLVTLKSGEQRKFIFLDRVKFPCQTNTVGETSYFNQREIEERDDIISVEWDNPHYFKEKYLGIVRDENHIFQTFKFVRNPVVKLEFIND